MDTSLIESVSTSSTLVLLERTHETLKPMDWVNTPNMTPMLSPVNRSDHSTSTIWKYMRALDCIPFPKFDTIAEIYGE